MAEREAERRADHQRMADMFQYMQSLGAAQGIAPPPPLFPPVDPALFHTPVSIKIWGGIQQPSGRVHFLDFRTYV
jgi:hypothetical protein